MLSMNEAKETFARKQRKLVRDMVDMEMTYCINRGIRFGSIAVDYMDELLEEELKEKGYSVEQLGIFGLKMNKWRISFEF